ncbi:MAG: hypothetical protein IJX03_00960, partial [Clostridia bacterium]|nr:hypothetical protein [Clostridia bacterium]
IIKVVKMSFFSKIFGKKSNRKFLGVRWFCDKCNDYLNKQEGFNDYLGTWKCQRCGFVNIISDQNISNECCRPKTDNRCAITCLYDDKLTEEDFRELAVDVAKSIKRLTVQVENHFVFGTVKTNSGISEWNFKLDFNDYGKISGQYWISFDNNQESDIPKVYGDRLKVEIIKTLNN